MGKPSYEFVLLHTTDILKTYETEIFKCIAELGRAGIYKEIFDTFEPGVGIELTSEMIENTDDINVDLLNELLNQTICRHEYCG